MSRAARRSATWPRRTPLPPAAGASWLAVALIALAAAAAPARAEPYPEGRLLLEPTQLEGRLGERDLVIVDMRSPAAYADRHVPGAVNLPVGEVVATVDGVPFEFVPERVRAALEGIGLTRGDEVVIYDDLGMMNAARLFWTLELVGHEEVALLHGGWNAWTAGGHPVSHEPNEPSPSRYEIDVRRDHLVTAEDLLERLDDPTLAILDARSAAEYSGEVALAERGGHIPGAIHLPWFEALTGGDTRPATESGWRTALRDDDVERFASASDLHALLRGRGLTPELEVVTYCQTLWRGAHAYFLLRLMGYEHVRGYDGSWAEWGDRADLPVVVGDRPGE